jgi:hypothetical protein
MENPPYLEPGPKAHPDGLPEETKKFADTTRQPCGLEHFGLIEEG